MRTPWPYPFWIAHRGAGTRAPENTLAAFREGGARGFRMLECDVKLSSDDVPFLLHDSALERTSSGVGRAGLQPWAALSRLDAGTWHSPGFAGEPLPTLEGVARWLLANGHAVNLEIKPTPGTETRTYESAVSRVEEIIRRLDSGDAGLRETLDLVREGRELVEYCAGELDAVSQGLEELRLEELVARLEPTAPASR